MEVSRGDLVIAAVAGDYGKPRPTLVIQADAFRGLASVTLLPLTSELANSPLVRIGVEPTPENGLREPSQVMIDKAATVRHSRIRNCIGRLDDATMRIVDRALARFLGLSML